MITPATPDDAPGLTACINAAYAAYRAQGIDLPDVAAGVAEDIAQNHVWVARDQHIITGGLILSIDATQAYLRNVAVHPDHGGKGIGRALIDTALTAAHTAGCTTIRLTTHAAMPGNVALYQHLGWHITEQDDRKVIMDRAL